MFKTIRQELKAHIPFTALGVAIGVSLMAVVICAGLPREDSATLFWILHPIHVFLSALVTTSMYRLHRGHDWVNTILIGYFGSVGIATLSDCIIPYVGEAMLQLPHPHLHIGAIEKWWLVNPLAFAGIALGCLWPQTKLPHAGHVLLSTWASLFHIMMALGPQVSAATVVLIGVFLFLAVWVPCCTSDIIFPLLFSGETPDSPSDSFRG